jgi:hypothetical protein
MPYPLTWPANLRPTTESWIVENADRSGGASLTGIEQVVSSGSGRVRSTLNFQLFRDETLSMRSLIAALRGRAGTVLVPPFDMTEAPQPGVNDPGILGLNLVPRGVNPPADLSAGLYVTVLADAPLRSTSMRLNFPGGRTPVQGNYMGVGQRLHILTSVSKVADGVFDCTFEPGLRQYIFATASVEFTSPVCRMRLATPVGQLPIDANYVTSVQLDFVEAPY